MKKGNRALSLIICVAMLICSLAIPGANVWGQEVPESETVTAEYLEDTEAATEEASEVETQPVEAQPEETEGKTSRAGGTDRSKDFEIDDLVIKIGDRVAYHYDGSDETITEQKFGFYGTQSISFEIAWSAIEEEQGDFLDKDFLVFKICSVSGDAATVLKDISSAKPLYDGDGLQLGTGYFLTEEQEDKSIALVYKVVFNSDIEGKHNVYGKMEGKATISDTENYNTVTISRDGETIAELEKRPNTSGGKPAGPGTGVEIPKVDKTVSGVDDSNGRISWKIDLTEYAERQFIDYESETPPTYQPFIVEEMLDCHQSFDTTSYFHAGASVLLTVPTYIYDKAGLDDGKYINAGANFFNLGTTSGIPMTFIDPSVDSDAANTVKATAKTWTIIKEVDPGNTGEQRERMIINFGAPGKDGLKYSDFSMFAKNLESLREARDNAKIVLEKYLSANSSENLTDDHGTTATKAKWEAWYQVTSDSYDYYMSDPYVYAGSLTVTTQVATKSGATSVVKEVKNGFRLSGGYTEVEKEISQSNFWSGSIGAEINKGDVVVYKTDSLYANDQNAVENDSVIGGLKDIEFQVFAKGSSTPIHFALDNGKYVLDTNGTYSAVKTDSDGRIVIGGLTKGEYYLKEISNPTGYYQDQNQQIAFNLSTDKVNYILAENARRGVQFLKVDTTDNDIVLEGAEFKLYTYTQNDYSDAIETTGFSKEIIDNQVYFIYDGTGTENLVTGSDGSLIITKLEAGRYYLEETVPPTGYDSSDTKYTFELEASVPNGDKIIDLGYIENAETVTPTGAVKLFKADSLHSNDDTSLADDTVISGAMPGIAFEVYDKLKNTRLSFDYDGTTYSNNAGGAVTTIVTDAAGTATIINLLDGDYYFKEITDADGYYSGQNQQIDFTIETDGTSDSIAYILAENIRRGIGFVKTDAADSSKRLEKAEFKLYTYTQDDYSDAIEVTGFSKQTINNTEYLIHDANGSAAIITDQSGQVKILGLLAGKYYLQESKAPEGYELSSVKHPFELSEAFDANMQEGILDLGVITNEKAEEPTESTEPETVVPPTGGLQESEPETDSETEFESEDTSTSTESEEVTTKETTKKPVITKQVVTKQGTAVKGSPKTGDNSRMRLYLVILLGAFAVIVGVVVHRRKGNGPNK